MSNAETCVIKGTEERAAPWRRTHRSSYPAEKGNERGAGSLGREL